MIKRILSFMFSVLFLLFLALPTVISMIDKTADVSVFYSTNEEEEKNGQEKDIEKNLLVNQILKDELEGNQDLQKKTLSYFLRAYRIPYINLISPPPEHFSIV